MRNRILILFLLLNLTAVFFAQAVEWKRYENKGGNFSVLFPGEPKDTASDESEGMESHTLAAMEKPAGYMVVYTRDTSEQDVDDASFQEFRNGFVKKLSNCAIDREGPRSPAIRGYLGRWYQFRCGEVNLTGNLFWGKHYSYAVMAVYPSNAGEPSNVKRFLDSFSLLDGSK
ncbi:MAG TPA: hypothetical protein VKL40_07600 [Candidatus Angelobacter sp.]|nr:hypothetical protein [Candidatus Angelobacter sp.]